MSSFDGVTPEDVWAAFDEMHGAKPLEDRYRNSETNSGEYFDCIRKIWASRLPELEAGRRISPYFIDWRFTPIEREAWNCIRRIGLRLYPQIPVAQYFLDFGDPRLKIGVELDGKAFHEKVRDKVRDERLWSLGWRIFRIPGRSAFKWEHPPTEPNFAGDALHDSYEYNRALETFSRTGDGVLWAIQVIYYARREYSENERCIAFGALHDHRLVDFPLTSEDEEDEDE